MPLLRVFITALLISLLGTLPLGALNVAAMQISVSDGMLPAIYFALGALSVEVIYVRISLVAMKWVTRQKKLFHWLEWITVVVIIALAISSFIAAGDPAVKKNIILSNTVHRFVLGLGMSALNPVQIPFWFGWSTVLFTKRILQPRNDHYNVYIIGIGIGTFIGNMVFILGGRFVADKLNNNQHVLHWIIGGVFTITAVIMVWRLLRKKDAISKLEDEVEVK